MDRFLDKYHSKFSKFTDWIYQLVIINLIAILMTIIGLGVFGLFPALMTTYALIKKRLNQEDFPLFKTFWDHYKSNFLKANAIGYVLVVFWTIIALSWTFYLNDLASLFHWIGLFIMGFVAISLFLVTTYTPVSFVYFPKFRTYEHLKFSLLMALGMPKVTLMIGLNTLFFYGFILIRFVTIFPFLAFSLPAFVNLLVARKKLLDVFSFFKDEHVRALSLNAFSKPLDIWSLYQDHLESSWPMSYDDFIMLGLDNRLVDKRLSMVLLDQKEAVIGFMVILKDGLCAHMMMLFIEEGYRKRGYGKRMLLGFEKKAYAYGFDTIKIGHVSSFFESLPRAFSRYLPFLKRHGYMVEQTDQGYVISKNIEVKEQ
jgi:uncharacterized membrane protein YesL